ncbi:MAG: asparagine synthase (glutamine-hydrolyzing) [Deltaproteobacteria bacterium]|nr:asparagine synthase (glutamine-hydrolyzing) [Deltaproteobacteria bacterium]
MCGIAGIVDLWGKNTVERPVLEAMAKTLVHRGPDDAGFHVEDRWGFAFRRLAILDLTTGNQPHYNEDRTIVSVCNGEIYNYRELKETLIARGHQFQTTCDVEVLVHLYEEEGREFLNRLNGQFSFAIYDRAERNLFLARDHVGITPLFFTEAGGSFIFASEVKAILKHPAVRRSVDLTGLDQVFTFPGTVSPTTMFTGIHSLKPGHCVTVRNGKVEIREYWDLSYPGEGEAGDGRPESFYVEQLDELLRQAVRYRLNADVPVGFYLSGGLDSSLIAAIISDVHPGEQRHSFSIGFHQPDIDERKYQRLVSSQVNSIHHEILFDWPDIINRIKTAVYHAESPLKESYDTCSLALSELVRSEGMKVILTGEGSDELFGGYVGYRFDMLQRDGVDEIDDAETQIEKEIRQRLWGDSRFLYERDFFAFRETKAALYSQAVGSMLDDFCAEGRELVDVSKMVGRHPLHKRSYADFKLRLSDHLLSDHGDRVSLANSVEARYPFLDREVIEFARTLPVSLLMRDAAEKYIVRRTARRYLPEAVVNRQKFGFVAPGSPYLVKQNVPWLNDLLAYDKIQREGYFNPDTIERLKKTYRGDNFTVNQTFDNDLLMTVITFEIFLEMFAMPDFN